MTGSPRSVGTNCSKVAQRLRRWWLATEVADASLASLGVIASTVAVEIAAVLIWRHGQQRLALAAVAVQLVGVLLGAPVALARLRHEPQAAVARAGASRIAVANVLRRLSARWRLLLALGVGVITLCCVAIVSVAPRLPLLVKPLVWLSLAGVALLGWGWAGALGPRRWRTPLPTSVEILTPLAAAGNPRAEAALTVGAVFCFVLASVLQFGALYGA